MSVEARAEWCLGSQPASGSVKNAVLGCQYFLPVPGCGYLPSCKASLHSAQYFIKLYCLVREAHVCLNNLPRVVI